MDTPELHHRLLAASAVSYDVDRHGKLAPTAPWYEAAGFTAPPTVVVGGLTNVDAAIVGTTPDGVVVAFRGTVPPSKSLQALLDWTQDLLAEPVATVGQPGSVHKGFLRAWERLAEGVVAAVRAQWTPGMGLHVTGHSKGGSLASLGAWGLYASGCRATDVVTFAAAHVGDHAFVRAYDEVFTQVRYENHLDLVPFVPPTPELADALAKIPLIGRLFASTEAWAYAKPGRLRYITESGAVIGGEPGLDELRIAQIAAATVKDEGARVGEAHSLVGPYGYARGVWPDGPTSAQASG